MHEYSDTCIRPSSQSDASGKGETSNGVVLGFFCWDFIWDSGTDVEMDGWMITSHVSAQASSYYR